MNEDRRNAQRLRSGVERAYSSAAENPQGDHPFPVGRQFAESLGYPRELLAELPAVAVEAFAGVSDLALFAEISPDSTVLDLGCGAGLDSLIAGRKTGSGGTVMGVDFSRTMLSRARTAAAQAGTGNVTFCQAGAENLPVADGAIDAVLINGILNLNPLRDAIFIEMARVVKPGGVVYAAELVLARPMPPENRQSEAEWFAWISGAKEGGAFLQEFRDAGFRDSAIRRMTRNARTKHPWVLAAEVYARK